MSEKYTIAQMESNEFSIEILNDIKTFYGFCDWFCSTKSLMNKAKKLMPKLKKVVRANKKADYFHFDPSNVYVFFKNNCPIAFPGTYDDFRICNAVTGKVLFTVITNDPFTENEGKYSLWAFTNGYDGKVLDGVSMKEITLFFEHGTMG